MVNTHSTSFAIQGLRQACTKSAVDIERALARLDGVVAAQVNYATEHATVVFNPSRISTAALVRAVRESGFDVPCERVVLNVDGFLYASSAHTVERMLERSDGVVRAHVDFKPQQIVLDVIAERVNRSAYEKAIVGLGFHILEQPSPNPTRDLQIRTLGIVVLASLSLISAGAHVGLVTADLLNAPLWVMAISVVAAYGIAWRSYYLALDVGRRGGFDRGVLVASIASASLLVGLLSAWLDPQSAFTLSCFVISIVLTTAWFVTRTIKSIVQHDRRQSIWTRINADER